MYKFLVWRPFATVDGTHRVCDEKCNKIENNRKMQLDSWAIFGRQRRRAAVIGGHVFYVINKNGDHKFRIRRNNL